MVTISEEVVKSIDKEISLMNENEITEEYNKYHTNNIDMENVYNTVRYDKLWIAYNSLTKNCKWNEKDKIFYPKFG